MQRILLLVALAMVPGSAWAAEADRSMPDYRIGQWTGTVDVVDVGSAPVQMDSRWGYGKVLMIDTLEIQGYIEGWTSHARVTILDPKSGIRQQGINDNGLVNDGKLVRRGQEVIVQSDKPDPFGAVKSIESRGAGGLTITGFSREGKVVWTYKLKKK
jgi:hypothetical protein